MFVKPDSDNNLIFINSLNIKAFPCGRRRSQLIDTDGNTNDQYSIPYDPEARLNTEANNRRHSSLNGYSQTYLDSWDADSETLSLVLAGYLFNIDLKGIKVGELDVDKQQAQINSFANAINGEAESIYANIRIEEVPLFSGDNLNYTTSVLRNQTSSNSAEACLDLPISSTQDLTNEENYYFSGLSFSTSPIAKPVEGDNTHVLVSNIDDKTRGVLNIYKDAQLHQQVISLYILKKVDGIWKIHEPAKLPKIEHGDAENSIKVGKIISGDISSTGNISAKSISCNGASVAQVKLAETSDDNGNTCYQLQFTNVAKAT